MAENCKAQILSDTPADEDAFGSHKRLAEAIVSLTSSGLGGKAIALSGSWGSGKSTVVHFIRDMLRKRKSDKKASVFVFDAWAHEGDPLRRTFIERLVDHLVDEGWIERSKWDADLDRITRRREESETTSSPVLTLWGKVLIFLLLLVPLGYSLFNTVTKDVAPTALGIPLWIFGLFIVLLPVLFGAGVSIVMLLGGETKNGGSDKVFAFFVNKLQEVNTVKTIRTPNPTTIEFQDVFVRLLDAALAKSSNQLLVVVDNIDRVGAEDAIAIWSTMRTLFEFDGARTAGWRKQFWLIVPIDKTALDRLWNAKTSDKKIVQAFIDKTFQIEFRISPPILSDWKNYFVKQLQIAFPGHKDNENELLDIYRLYRQKVVANDGVVTPRDVKLFINSIVTLHLQWADKISLQSQALFAIYSERIKDPQRDLIQGDFLDRRVLNLVGGSDWQTHLAALHYNVDPKDAIQVLIGRSIEQALTTGNSAELLKYKEIPGFPEVIDRTIETNYEEWAKDEPAALALSALCLHEAGSSMSPTSSKIWDWLRKGTTVITTWKNLSGDVGHGLVAILKHSSKGDAETAGKAFLKILSKVQTADETMTKQIHAWLQALLPVACYVHETSPATLSDFRIDSSSMSYIEIASLLPDSDVPEAVKLLIKPAADHSNIATELVRQCVAAQMRETQVKAIGHLLKIDSGPWTTVATALATRLNFGNSLDSAEHYSCIRALLMLAENPGDDGSRTALENSCKTGHMFHHLARFGSDDAKAIAMAGIAILEIMPSMAGLRSHAGNSAAGIAHFNAFLSNPEGQPAILDNFVPLIVELGKVGRLIQLGSTTPNTEKLAASALKLIAKKFPQALPPQVLFQEREALRKLIGEDLLAERLSEHAKDESLAAQIKEAAFELQNSWFYLIMLKSNPAAYGPYLIEGLQKVTREIWTAELEGESATVALLLAFGTSNPPVNLGHEFSDALLDHAKKVLTGQLMPATYKDSWSLLANVLRANSRREFVANLRDAVIDEADQKVFAVIELFGEMLRGGDILWEKADDVVRKLFTQIAERGHVVEIKWMGSTIKMTPKILKSCNDDYRTAFQDRLIDLVRAGGHSPESKDCLKLVAEAMGLTIEEPKEPANEETK